MQNDQVEFTPLMHIWFNNQKSIDAIHCINRLKKNKSMIMSISERQNLTKIITGL